MTKGPTLEERNRLSFWDKVKFASIIARARAYIDETEIQVLERLTVLGSLRTCMVPPDGAILVIWKGKKLEKNTR